MTIDPIFIIKFLASFLFYFIGGYLLYASLFAAIGAAVDNETDSQQFLTPLSIIIVIGLYIGFAAMKSPESPMVFWSSLIRSPHRSLCWSVSPSEYRPGKS